MQTKVAIATEDGTRVSAHFGRARYFEVVTLEDGEIVASERRDKPFHQGDHSAHHAHGGPDSHAGGMVAVVGDCSAVVAGGMGTPAYQAIQAAGLNAILTDEHDLQKAAKAYASGTLVSRTERLH